MVFLILLAVPSLVGLGFYLFSGTKITGKEFALMMGLQVLVAGISAICIYWSNTHDVEVWNGRVTAKQSERVSCTHQHCCGWSTTCTGSGSSQHCTTTCSMWCDDHPYDVDWAVYTSLRERLEIDRLSSQGLEEPPRWTRVVVGEPTSTGHSYENYIKAAPDSLFRRTESDARKAKVPDYDFGEYDYYRAHHFKSIGLTPADSADWDIAFDNLSADLGARKQANVIFVLVKGQPRDYFYDLERAWMGGKKNDVIIVAAIDDHLAYQWVEVMTWSKNEMVKIAIRDSLMEKGILDRTQATQAVYAAVDRYYERRPMKDFEYLKSSITPSVTQWVVSLVIGVLVALGAGIVCHQNDLFNEEFSSHRRTRRY